VNSFKNIFLVGMPGAGKTTLGKELAGSLSRKFIDIDDVVEDQLKMSITDIFKNLGESQFRIAEHRALLSVLEDTSRVISTGGGTPCFHNNMELMNKEGITIFLDPPIDELLNRLKNDFKSRPKLAESPSLKEVLENIYTLRSPVYKKAHFVFTQSNLQARDVVNALKSESNR
jgi:shikimate kinase